MLVQLLEVFAEFERKTIIDRVAKGMATKASKGKWPGGKRPYSYSVDCETQKLVPHPEESPHLRRSSASTPRHAWERVPWRTS
jgi:site-specific DNA recombinase